MHHSSGGYDFPVLHRFYHCFTDSQIGLSLTFFLVLFCKQTQETSWLSKVHSSSPVFPWRSENSVCGCLELHVLKAYKHKNTFLLLTHTSAQRQVCLTKGNNKTLGANDWADWPWTSTASEVAVSHQPFWPRSINGFLLLDFHKASWLSRMPTRLSGTPPHLVLYLLSRRRGDLAWGQWTHHAGCPLLTVKKRYIKYCSIRVTCMEHI